MTISRRSILALLPVFSTLPIAGCATTPPALTDLSPLDLNQSQFNIFYDRTAAIRNFAGNDHMVAFYDSWFVGVFEDIVTQTISHNGLTGRGVAAVPASRPTTPFAVIVPTGYDSYGQLPMRANLMLTLYGTGERPLGTWPFYWNARCHICSIEKRQTMMEIEISKSVLLLLRVLQQNNIANLTHTPPQTPNGTTLPGFSAVR